MGRILLLGKVVAMAVIGGRIKEARVRAGLTQEQAGVAAGLDEMSASTRMNRYELDKRVPSPDFLVRLAQALRVPPAFFYSDHDVEAALLLAFHSLSSNGKKQALEAVDALRVKEPNDGYPVLNPLKPHLRPSRR